MPWVEVFAAFFVSHLVGDYLLQTDWQALNKRGGLARRRPLARRALLSHVSTYTLAFVPAMAVLSRGADIAWVLPTIFVSHAIQDDGGLIGLYMSNVKGLRPSDNLSVAAQVDQTFHIVELLGLALLVGR